LSFNVANPPGANAEKHVVGPIAATPPKRQQRRVPWIDNERGENNEGTARLSRCNFENAAITFRIGVYVSENSGPIRLEILPAILTEVQVRADKKQASPRIAVDMFKLLK
jgi:hypothetical protein